MFQRGTEPPAPRWLITGLNGTLAPVLAQRARAAGAQVLAWNRHELPPEDAAAGGRWLGQVRPQAIAHLAVGSPAWAGQLAAFAARHGIPMVVVSSAMVFDHQPDGPHLPGDPCNARDDYGRLKIATEEAVTAAHPAASVLRIGWQIGGLRAGNHMLAALDRWQQEQGHVAASRLWTPACSFMEDTADVLAHLLQEPRPGVLHFDSNAVEAHAFDRIVAALQAAFGRSHWQLRPEDGYRHDQRLAGGPLQAPPLSARLPALR